MRNVFIYVGWLHNLGYGMGINIKLLESLAQRVGKYTKASGAKNILQTKPPSIKALDITGLKLQPLTDDIFQKTGTIVDTSKKFLPGFKAQRLRSIKNITTDNLVAVHMTNYMPTGGVIKTTKAATKDINGISEYRDTVHFSLNHVVENHTVGNNWKDYPVAVLTPLKGLMGGNKKINIIGGEIDDFFIKKSVRLPEGTVIVRKNPNIPEGKFRVLNAELIDEFRNTKGIKIIETSGNVKDAANRVVGLMGYTRIDKLKQRMSGLSDEMLELLRYPEKMKEIIENNPEQYQKLLEGVDHKKQLRTQKAFENAWKKFIEDNGLRHYQHTFSPYSRSEALIEHIKNVSIKGNSWIHEMEGGFFTKAGQKVDYKAEFLNVIDEIKASLGKGESISYNIDKLKGIISKSKTPKDAVIAIEQKLKLRPMVSVEQCLQSVNEVTNDDLYNLVDNFLGLSPMYKMAHNGKSQKEIMTAMLESFVE